MTFEKTSGSKGGIRITSPAAAQLFHQLGVEASVSPIESVLGACKGVLGNTILDHGRLLSLLGSHPDYNGLFMTYKSIPNGYFQSCMASSCIVLGKRPLDIVLGDIYRIIDARFKKGDNPILVRKVLVGCGLITHPIIVRGKPDPGQQSGMFFVEFDGWSCCAVMTDHPMVYEDPPCLEMAKWSSPESSAMEMYNLLRPAMGEFLPTLVSHVPTNRANFYFQGSNRDCTGLGSMVRLRTLRHNDFLIGSTMECIYVGFLIGGVAHCFLRIRINEGPLHIVRGTSISWNGRDPGRVLNGIIYDTWADVCRGKVSVLNWPALDCNAFFNLRDLEARHVDSVLEWSMGLDCWILQLSEDF